MRAALLALLLAAPAAAEDAGLAAETAWWKGKLVVVSVDADSSAQSAGLKHGDRILSIGGKPVKAAKDLSRATGKVGVELVLVAAGPKEKPRAVSIFRERRAAKPARAVDPDRLEAGLAADDAVSLFASGKPEDLERSAEKGFPPAMDRLARTLKDKNPAKAAELAKKAAAAGHADAMLLLSAFYAKGAGVEADEAQADAWLRKSAEAGGKDAACRLAAGKDPQESLYWAMKVKTTPCGRLALARHYAAGSGVDPDPLKAYDLAARANAAGERGAAALMKSLEKDIAAEDLASLKQSLEAEGVELPGIDPVTRRNEKARAEAEPENASPQPAGAPYQERRETNEVRGGRRW